jgi:hypothetical protein
MRFKTVSPQERDAAFAVVSRRALAAIDQWVPIFWRGKARSEFISHKDEVLATIDEALDAAQKVRTSKGKTRKVAKRKVKKRGRSHR